jgi:hypothetical protein
MVQFTGTFQGPPACETCEPFINQNASAPALRDKIASNSGLRYAAAATGDL